ncbi:MAG: PAS domain-containing protein [Coprothermobacterota bacterium]|nr:PAS domain-containing protein [Coprothermobacterota bacterium]
MILDVRYEEGESQLHHREGGDRLIAQISSHFLNIPPEEVDQGIQDALTLLREFCQSEGAFVRLLSADSRYFLQASQYFSGPPGCNSELLPRIHVDEIPWVAAKLRRREAIEISTFAGLPPEAEGERRILDFLGIRSSLSVPILFGGSLFGWIGLNQYSREMKWNPETATLLRIIGGMVASAIVRRRSHESLVRSEVQYHATIEGIDDPLHVVGPDLRIILANSAFRHVQREWHGEGEPAFTDAEILEWAAPDVFPFGGDLQRQEYEQVFSTSQTLESLTHLQRGEREGIFRVKKIPIMEGGKVSQVITMIEDVTSRTRSEQALHESEEQARTILESSPDAILLVALNGEILLANQQAAALHGYATPHAMVGLPVGELVTPEENIRIHQESLRMLGASAALTSGAAEGPNPGGRSATLEVTLAHTNGSTLFGELKLSLICNALGAPRAFLGIARDIRRRKLFEEQMRSIPRRLLEAQEGERRVIARELHDQIGQALLAVKLALQNLPAQEQLEEERILLKESVDTIDQAIEKVRSLSLELRPTALDDLGLIECLRGSLDRLARRAGFKAQLLAEPGELLLPGELETVCFRVTQEALSNVVRHAGAREVVVALRQRGDSFQISVRDDGCGFDLEHAMEASLRGESLGLVGMQERVLLVQGQLTIHTGPGQGTEVRAVFPLGKGN